MDTSAIVAITAALAGAIGGLLGGVASVWNTARKQRNDREDVRCQRAERVFESFHHGMIVADRDLNIVLANKQARAMTGYVDLVGRNVNELIPQTSDDPDLRERHRQHVARYFDDPHTRRMGTTGMRLTMVDRYGRVKRMRLSLTPMENEYGGVEVTVGMEVIQE